MPSHFLRPPSGISGGAQEVVLLDEEWLVTLYVAVGLRNAGCTVHIISAAYPERPDVKYLGRRITREVAPLVRSDGYVSTIEAALASRPSASVLALTETVMYRLWDADPAWLPRIYPNPSTWQRELLRNKARLSDCVANAGSRVPAQRSVASMADLNVAMEIFGLPLVVKGVTGFGGSRVEIVHTAAEARDAAEKLAKDGNCFLQQYVSGPTFLVGGLFHDGQPIRLYAGEKLECAGQTGPSLRLRSHDDEALIAEALTAVRAIRWNGLASMDIMRGQDGNYYFIEFNPRPWGSIAAAAQTGVDLFHPLAQLLAGHVPTPDLSFSKGVQSTLFPQVALARLRSGGIRPLTSLLREPRIWLDAPWSDLGLTAHLARHIWWNWLQGTRNNRTVSRQTEQIRQGKSQDLRDGQL